MEFWAIAGVVLLGAGYVLSCWWWPFTACPRCEGGKKYGSGRKVWRDCRRCRGSGRRLRVGRRVWNYYAARRKQAS